LIAQSAGWVGLEHPLREQDRARRHARHVAVGVPAGHHHRVVLGGVGVLQRAVHGAGVGLVEVVEGPSVR
jgi:hypothetical protein